MRITEAALLFYDKPEIELREAKIAMSECDDIKLDQPLADAIRELQESREYWRKMFLSPD